MNDNRGTTAAIDNHASQKPHHTGDLDAMLWGIEKDPLLRQTITVVLILDRAPHREVLLDRLERGSRTLPSFRHRLVEAPLRLSTPRWIADTNFDLSYHVRWIGAPGDGSLDGVLEFARQSTMSGLDRERPLWTITVVEGLKGGQAALILTVNRVMSDGTGPLAIFGVLGDLTSYTGHRILRFLGRSAGSTARTLPTVVRRPRDTATTVAKDVWAVTRIVAPNFKTLSPLMTERLAGAKVLSIFPFGPPIGTAANITLVGYHHKALIGINVDAAAVPDLGTLVACIREGLDAVIALGDGDQP
ncbi:MAG TPA: wax ester/triacylglycerol synthase domain-containing protein [Mycobacterium sp.]|nr:wax ester/triacylglycerol synthase domain-containing protein [Mycobacterium sp.]